MSRGISGGLNGHGSRPLAYLAPDLTEQILSGRQLRALTLGALTSAPLPADWKLQRSLFQRAGAI